MLFFVMLMLITLFLEVVFQFLFVFYANLLGQSVIKDLRIKLFKKIINFKMAYFDDTSIGRLVTRSVSDIETIASIFSQGLFMIIADLLKMSLVVIVMLYVDWGLSLIVFQFFRLLYMQHDFFKNL